MTTATTRNRRGGWLKPRSYPVPGDVLAALAELGIQIHRVEYEEAQGPCAMHFARVGKYDRHPSWSCNTETGVFNCFSCQWRGPFVQLVVDVLGLNWDDAVEWVRKRGGIERVRKILGRGEYIDEIVSKPAPPPVTEADLALFVEPPVEALKKRGLLSSSTEKYGVLWDAERDMWITPIRDHDGVLLGWQEKTERHFRNKPFSVEKGKTLFGSHVLQGDTAILLESPLDCLRLHSVGVQGAVSSFGAGVTEEQMQLLFSRAKRIIIALDNDREGHKAASILRDRYRGMGRRLAFYNYGNLHVKDPGDQSGDEIRFGVERALSSLRVRFRLAA